MSTTTARPPLPILAGHNPYVAVQWSAGRPTTAVGTVVSVREALREGAGERPTGHTPVRTADGVIYVMTLTLRPYAPTAAALTRMRAYLSDGNIINADGMPDSHVVNVIARGCVDGVARFA